MAPGNRGFKGFRNDVIVHQEVANIGNAEGQLITSASVLGARLHSSMASGYAIQVTLLLLDLSACSFEDKSAGDHLVGLESFDARDEKFLRFALQIRHYALGFRLQGQTKLELKIVDEADACWWSGFASEIVHERESTFERGKQYRSVFLHFRQWKNFDDCRCNNAERSLGTKHQSPQIQTNGFAWRRARPFKLARGGNNADIEH